VFLQRSKFHFIRTGSLKIRQHAFRHHHTGLSVLSTPQGLIRTLVSSLERLFTFKQLKIIKTLSTLFKNIRRQKSTQPDLNYESLPRNLTSPYQTSQKNLHSLKYFRFFQPSPCHIPSNPRNLKSRLHFFSLSHALRSQPTL
jgi:hypothetical protein